MGLLGSGLAEVREDATELKGDLATSVISRT
jgi:hypothetical protein